METGVSHNKQRLHKVGYFRELLSSNEEVQENIRPLLRLSRETIVRCQRTEYALVSSLQRDPLLAERIKRLRTVPGVGPITALTWALEVGDVSRFRSVKQAISYCGLCGEEKSSADKVLRTPLSKQRNKHIQRVLVEAAKLAPRQNHELALIHEREKHPPLGAPHTAAQHRPHVQLLADARQVPLPPAQLRSRPPRHHPQIRHARQQMNQLFRQTVAEVVVVRPLQQVLERQHHDRFLARTHSPPLPLPPLPARSRRAHLEKGQVGALRQHDHNRIAAPRRIVRER